MFHFRMAKRAKAGIAMHRFPLCCREPAGNRRARRSPERWSWARIETGARRCFAPPKTRRKEKRRHLLENRLRFPQTRRPQGRAARRAASGIFEILGSIFFPWRVDRPLSFSSDSSSKGHMAIPVFRSMVMSWSFSKSRRGSVWLVQSICGGAPLFGTVPIYKTITGVHFFPKLGKYAKSA